MNEIDWERVLRQKLGHLWVVTCAEKGRAAGRALCARDPLLAGQVRDLLTRLQALLPPEPIPPETVSLHGARHEEP